MKNALFEGVKDDAVAIASKFKKENSPEFKKLMTMLDEDRGLMVPFTKWLLGVPPKPTKEEAEKMHKQKELMRKKLSRRKKPDEETIGPDAEMPDDDVIMPHFRELSMMQRVRPVPIEDLEHIYNEVKLLGYQNIKRDLNSFKNAEEFSDYLTKELGDKQIRNALNITTYNENLKKNVGIPFQVKDMIYNTPEIYNLLRANKEHALTICEFVARKGARYKTKEEIFDAISSKLSELDDFNRDSVAEKIKKFNLKAQIIEDVPWGPREKNCMLVYIEDVTASANLGSQEWCIAQAEGFGFHNESKAASKENIHKLKKATSTAQSYFNNTYQLSKYKKCYFLFDFSRDSADPLRKICFIIEPGGAINSGWDAKDTCINNASYGRSAEELVLSEYPELNQ